MMSTSSKGSDDGKKGGSGTLNGLKLRYDRFVEAFLANGGNATKAAQYAGYDETSQPDQTVRLHLNSHPQGANHIAGIIRGENPNARLNQALRLVYKMQDALVYFADELRRSEPELSGEEIFKRFVEKESPYWGFNLAIYKSAIIEALEIRAANIEPQTEQPAAAAQDE